MTKSRNYKFQIKQKQWYWTYAELMSRIRARDPKLAKAIRRFKKQHGVLVAQDMLDILVQAGVDDGK